MPNYELLEFRKKLEHWQRESPQTLRSILIQIIENNYPYSDILATRIYKAIKDLANATTNNIPTLYSKHEYESVFQQAKTLHKIIMDLT
jgi:hypothetical protein